MNRMTRSPPVAGRVASADEDSDRPSKRSKPSKDGAVKPTKPTSIRQTIDFTKDKNPNKIGVQACEPTKHNRGWPLVDLYSAYTPDNAFGFDGSSDTSNDEIEIQRCLDSSDGEGEGREVTVGSFIHSQDSTSAKNVVDAVEQLPSSDKGVAVITGPVIVKRTNLVGPEEETGGMSAETATAQNRIAGKSKSSTEKIANGYAAIGDSEDKKSFAPAPSRNPAFPKTEEDRLLKEIQGIVSNQTSAGFSTKNTVSARNPSSRRGRHYCLHATRADTRSHSRRYNHIPKSPNLGLHYIGPNCSPELTLDVIATNQFWFEKPIECVIHENFGMKLKVRNLRNYCGNNWLEDTAINFYLELIKARNNNELSHLPKVYVFHAEIVKMYVESGYQYVDVIEKSADPDDIFEYDLLFFPIHDAEHWSLICVDIIQKKVIGYDSVGKDLTSYVQGITSYVIKEYRKLKNLEAIHNEQNSHQNTTKCRSEKEFFLGWRRKPHVENLPRQENYNDCGVFILQFAEYLSRRQEFDFTQKHMRYFRERMAFETIHGTLLDIPNKTADSIDD